MADTLPGIMINGASCKLQVASFMLLQATCNMQHATFIKFQNDILYTFF